MAKKSIPTHAGSEGATASGSPEPSPVARFEHSLDELEQLVQTMERGELSLDDSLAAYERGVALYRQCQGALDQAELRVKLLANPADPDSAQAFPNDASDGHVPQRAGSPRAADAD